jgi:multidrug efflux pump subunit AcrA (membrane-fusion protein)
VRAWRVVVGVGASALLLLGAPIAGTILAADVDAPAVPPAPLAADRAERPPAIDGPGRGEAPPNDFVGVLLPPRMASLTPRIEEKVLDAPVKVGRPVRRGDVIVAFDLTLPRRELAVAEAQLAGARAEAAGASSEVDAARRKAARRKATIAYGGENVALFSKEEAEQTAFDVQTAEARAASAAARIVETQSRIELLRLVLHENDLRAPFDGVVSAVNFEPGMTAHVGDVAARVVGGRGLRARVAVPEESAPLLASARRLRLTIDGRTFFAAVDQVPPEPEPISRTFIVEGDVEDLDRECPDGCLAFAGRSARAAFVAPESDGAP